MADNQRSVPVADLCAIIEERNVDPHGNVKAVDRFVELCPLWRTEKGNLSGTLHSEPVQWRSPGVMRRLVIRMRTTPSERSEPQRGHDPRQGAPDSSYGPGY